MLTQTAAEPRDLQRGLANGLAALGPRGERRAASIRESILQNCQRSVSYLDHYHSERNHQGLANRLIRPGPGVGTIAGEIHCGDGWVAC